MPLTAKGAEVKSALTKEYGEKKGESVLYAMKNSGKLSGFDERQRQAADLAAGRYVSGRDRAKVRR